MAIYGVNFGGAVSTWLLSKGISGPTREVVNYQIRFDVLGLAVLVPLFYLEWLSHAPLVIALISKYVADPWYQMASVYLLFNLVAAVAMVFNSAIRACRFSFFGDDVSVVRIGGLMMTLFLVMIPNSPWPRKTNSELVSAGASHSQDFATNSSVYVSAPRSLATRFANDRVDELMESAKQDVVDLRLTQPLGNNAMEKYRLILEIDPQNVEALRCLGNLASKYLQMSTASEYAGKYRQAGIYLDRAIVVLNLAIESQYFEDDRAG